MRFIERNGIWIHTGTAQKRQFLQPVQFLFVSVCILHDFLVVTASGKDTVCQISTIRNKNICV